MPKMIDLTGQIINNNRVIKRAANRNNRVYWECECICGNIYEVESYSLRSGHTKSCGCFSSKKNIIGKKYGLLTVIKEAASNKDGDAMWECQCECGNIITTKGSRLRQGGALSCGCVRTNKLIQYNQQNNILDISNQRFGLLTAIKPTEKRTNNKDIIWECICDCGKNIEVSGHNLRNGNTKSCGCQRNKSFGENKIEEILLTNNIPFVKEKSFTDLIFEDTGYLARFDFYVDNKYLIEFDGRQHFIQGNGNFDNEEKFKHTQKHDKIKNEYCKKHNIPLIRIPFTEIDNININMLKPETSQYLI